MNTWRDILQSLLNCRGRGRLDDPADVVIDGEIHNIEVLEVEVEEVNDNRLIAYPTEEIEKWDK